MKQKKERKGWKTALAALLALLLSLAVLAGCGQNDLNEDDASQTESDALPSTEPETAETTATPEPSYEPAVPMRVQLLRQMGWVGDENTCAMTSDQALACAQQIRAANAGVVMAAIFDGGSGVPILWIAQADAMRTETDDVIALTGHYADKLYGFANGAISAYDWMTTLLRSGDDGVMVKLSRDSTKVRFYTLINGAFASEPFGVGLWDHSGDATYNGVSIGAGSEVGLWDFYRAAGEDLTVLLEAMSGDSENLYLTGPWMRGEDLSTLLEQYASSVA